MIEENQEKRLEKLMADFKKKKEEFNKKCLPCPECKGTKFSTSHEEGSYYEYSFYKITCDKCGLYISISTEGGSIDDKLISQWNHMASACSN